MKEITLYNDCFFESAHDQFVVKCSVDTKERGGVAKILSAHADCKVNSVEALDKEALLSGKVIIKIIYLDKNGNPQGLDYFCDFSEKVSCDDVTADMLLSADCSVVDLSTAISDEISVASVCDVSLKRIGKRELKCLDFDEENYYKKVQPQSLVRLEAIPDTVFEINEEVESGGKVDKVLLFDSLADLVGVERSGDSAKVSGNLVSDVVFLRDGEIACKRISLPFQEDIAADGDMDLSVSVKSSRLVLAGTDDDVIFQIEALLVVNGRQVKTEEIETVVDVFAEDRELNCTVQKLPCRKFYKDFCLETTVSASADADKLPDGSRLLADSVGRVNIANIIPQENGVVIEGLVALDVIYISDDVIRSVQVELPFSNEFNADGVSPDDYLRTTALVNKVTVGISQSVLKLSAELSFHVSAYRSYNLTWISECEVGKEKPKSPYGISVYFIDPKKEVWNIAKELNVDPASLDGNLDENSSRITIFRKRKD